MPLSDDDRSFLVALGTRLRQIRTDKGMTQEEVAEVLGLGQPGTVSRYEGGHHDLSATRLRQLADLYGVTLQQLVGVENGVPAVDEDPELTKGGRLLAAMDPANRSMALEILKVIRRSGR